MRWVLLGLAIGLAACGEKDDPVKVTHEERPDPSVEARANALRAKQDFEALEADPKVAADAERDWNIGEIAANLTDKKADAAAAFDRAAKAYRDAIRAVEKKQHEANEKAYRDAVDVQAKTLALRTQLDSLRRNLSDRATAATGWEKAVLTQTVRVCNEEVFGRDSLLAIDTKIETAKALYADKRYAEATKAYTAAQMMLLRLPKQCEAVESRLRAEGLRGLAIAAGKRARQAYTSQNLKPPDVAQRAFEAATRGEDRLAVKDYDGAMAAFDEARKLYDEASEMAPVVMAARDEATRTFNAAVTARTAWRAYATREGIDPYKPAEQAENRMVEGDQALREGEYAKATKAFREARKLFAALESKTPGKAAELKQKQQGPAPQPEGKYASKRHRAAARLGLNWLARHQDKDGRWDSDNFHKNDPPDDKCDGPGKLFYDVGVTGLALLAFLEAGYADRGEGAAGYYAYNVHRGLQHLMSVQDPTDGVFGSRAFHAFMYGHCIATRAMCLAYGATKDERYRKPAQMGLHFVAKARNPGLAWRYMPRGKQNDTSVTAWAIQALDAGRAAGLIVDEQAFAGGKLWVEKMTDPEFGQVGYNMPGGAVGRPQGLRDRFPPEQSQAMTAAGLNVRLIAGASIDAVFRKGLNLIAEAPPRWNPDDGSIDMYYWYLGQRVFRHKRVAKSARLRVVRRVWDNAVRDAILRHQHPSGSGARTGSWDPIGAWGGEGGRVYSTAIMTLALLPADG